MLSVIYAECHLCRVSFLLSVNYAECRKQAVYAECRFAECRYAERRGAAKTTCVKHVSLFFRSFRGERNVLQHCHWAGIFSYQPNSCLNHFFLSRPCPPPLYRKTQNPGVMYLKLFLLQFNLAAIR